jgi:cell wall-associated NlpC family hydrolase
MGFNSEQIQNAALIYKVGQQMGMSNRDIQIALITSMVESNLVNVNYGDRDSLGLFQQRASWGSADQRMDPNYSARKFFSALKGLGDKRNSMNMGAAAQAVQRSAYPTRYSQRIGDMRSIWPRVATSAGSPQFDLDGNPYGTPDPQTGRSKANQPMMPEQAVATPSVEDMLGAWDTTSAPIQSDTGQTVQQQEPPVQIGPHTNKTVLQPLMDQQTGGYSKGVDGWRKAVTEIARRFVGTPYVWGGTSPSGFDCSGLIQYVYGQAGKHMPRISYQQANSGSRTGLKNLRPGDLVAWDNSSRNSGADHIAIYLGNGQIIEAPRPGLSVRIRTLGSNEGAWGVSLG